MRPLMRGRDHGPMVAQLIRRLVYGWDMGSFSRKVEIAKRTSKAI